MKRVQSKLLLLSLAALSSLVLFVGLVVHSTYLEYRALSGFREQSTVSLAAYDLARNMTIERQLAYQASAFLGEGTPEQMIERYREQVAASDRRLSALQRAVAAVGFSVSERFQRSLAEALAVQGEVSQIRTEILDPNRSRNSAEAQALKTRALATYDVVLFAQSNFLPVLALETKDAELARRIITQDNIARMQRDFWKVKGLLNTVLRDRVLADRANGEMKMKLEL